MNQIKWVTGVLVGTVAVLAEAAYGRKTNVVKLKAVVEKELRLSTIGGEEE